MGWLLRYCGYSVTAIQALFVVLLIVCAAGCTSVQWRDSSGATHHAGLVAGRLATGLGGARFERYALGVDVRLHGPDAGLTLGWKHSDSTAPRMIEARTARDLVDAVVTHMNGTLPERPLSVSWSFFHVVEGVTARQTVLNTAAIGADLALTGPNAGLGLGYRGARAFAGRALNSHVVQIVRSRSDDPDAWDVTLGTLVGPESAKSARTALQGEKR